jgi:dTDP-4-dehydrorhamnose reductase
VPSSPTRILLTGVNGQLGSALQKSLFAYDVVALDRASLDLTSPNSIRRVVRDHKPDWIVNPAAYTAVDKAEAEPDAAFAINGTAPAIFAEEAASIGAVLLH